MDSSTRIIFGAEQLQSKKDINYQQMLHVPPTTRIRQASLSTLSSCCRHLAHVHFHFQTQLDYATQYQRSLCMVVSMKVEKSIRKVREMIPACIFWCVWTERNRRCFDGLSTPCHTLKARRLLWPYSWQNLAPAEWTTNFLNFVCSFYSRLALLVPK